MTAVSVKSRTRIWLKRDSLFLRWRGIIITRTIARLPASDVGIDTTNEKSNMQAVNDAQNRLLALVKSILDQNAITAQLTPATLLVDVGLTSMDMVNLMFAVEAEFDFIIPQSEITPENFQ